MCPHGVCLCVSMFTVYIATCIPYLCVYRSQFFTEIQRAKSRVQLTHTYHLIHEYSVCAIIAMGVVMTMTFGGHTQVLTLCTWWIGIAQRALFLGDKCEEKLQSQV